MASLSLYPEIFAIFQNVSEPVIDRVISIVVFQGLVIFVFISVASRGYNVSYPLGHPPAFVVVRLMAVCMPRVIFYSHEV